jgi:hypothetical protein
MPNTITSDVHAIASSKEKKYLLRSNEPRSKRSKNRTFQDIELRTSIIDAASEREAKEISVYTKDNTGHLVRKWASRIT